MAVVFIALFLLICGLGGPAWGGLSEKLLFVGEYVEVLTLASKHPEPPLEAPAISQVITAEEIKQGGFRTLAELLRTVPGLFVGRREADEKPYFRGVPEGFLLLYDGVPFTSDSTKALYNLGEEISLEGLSRVEIVRGPGSVLWGPDAFAGLINLVPKRQGKASISLLTGSPLKDFSSNLFFPFRAGEFSGALNLYYYGRDPSISHYAYPGGAGSIGRGEFYEALLSLDHGPGFRLTGRLSRFRRPFVMQGAEGFSWPGTHKSPISFFKVETQKALGPYTLRGTFYYEYLLRREKELFLTEKQKNHLLYGEILLDRSFDQQKTLLTLGVSWRKNYVRDATVEVRGYLPAFLKEANRQFRPLVETADFNTDLYSGFFQLRHKFRRADFWIGLRLSDHDHYETVLSRQFGLLLRLPRNFYFKLAYATSYRTPYSAQFLGRHKLDEPEKMRSLSLELRWVQKKGLSFFVSPFYNRLSHHISEDPFGGYSRPLTHYFLGAEAGLSLKRKFFTFSGAYTFFNDWGEREKYRVIDYIIIRPGREPIYHFTDYEKPFSRGPKSFGHLDLFLRPKKNFSFFARATYVGKRPFYHLKSGAKKRLSRRLLLDLSLKYKFERLVLELDVKNLFDSHYYTAGKFSPVPAERFGLFLKVSRPF